MQQAGLGAVSITSAGYERSMSFALFRLMGPGATTRLFPQGSSRRRGIERMRFYLDLGDIMFVTARSPVAGEPL